MIIKFKICYINFGSCPPVISSVAGGVQEKMITAIQCLHIIAITIEIVAFILSFS